GARLPPVIPLEGRHRNQAEVLNEQGDRDVDPGDREVVAELHPGQADGPENRKRRKLTTLDAQQRRAGGEEDEQEPGERPPDSELGQHQRRVAQLEEGLDGVAAGGEKERGEDDERVSRLPARRPTRVAL